MKNNQLVKQFSPMWFAVSMGIGGFTLVIYQMSSMISFFKIIAIILAVFNLLVFITMLIPWTIRWFSHKESVNQDIKHPVSSNFFITMPVGLMLIGLQMVMIGSPYFGMIISMNIALIIWFFGVILALIFSVATTFNMMRNDSISPELTNFSWFISPVATIVVPLLGNNLVKYFFANNIALATFINLIDISFFGIGIILFMVLISIVMNRFLLHKMPGSMILPSFWILLGPVGVGTVSLLGLAETNTLLGWISSSEGLNILAYILWGFGIWAFSLLIVVSIYYIKSGKIPFSLSWWAFIFPLSAYSLSTLNLFHMTQVIVIKYYLFLLVFILIILFIVTISLTIKGVINKKLLYPNRNN
ncbi:MAG: C4-dicarboxylate ABC transporter [Candidatus Izemoplasmatales bacterium]